MNHEEAFIQAHEEAVAEHTAEGYLLGDLTDAAAEAFEAHYFDCRVCANDIRSLQLMLAAGPEAVGSDSVPVPVGVPEPARPLPAKVVPFRRRVQQSLSFAATAALAFILGSIPHAPDILQVPRFAGSITGVTRGANDDLQIHFEGNEQLAVVIGGVNDQYPSYRVELRDRLDKVLKARSLSPKEARNINGITVLLRPLPAGRYFLAVVGVRKEGNPSELARSGVVVE